MSERIAKIDELRGWLGDARFQSYLMAGVPADEIADYVRAMKAAKAEADRIKAEALAMEREWRQRGPRQIVYHHIPLRG